VKEMGFDDRPRQIRQIVREGNAFHRNYALIGHKAQLGKFAG